MRGGTGTQIGAAHDFVRLWLAYTYLLGRSEWIAYFWRPVRVVALRMRLAQLILSMQTINTALQSQSFSIIPRGLIHIHILGRLDLKLTMSAGYMPNYAW